MRILPPLTALAVAATLYVAVFERDRLMATTAAETGAQPAAAPAGAPPSPSVAADGAISVVGLASRASLVQNAVIARGRTEAARQVEVRAETGGLVRSEPLRRGAFVTAGQTLCTLDPGTRPQQEAEAEARVIEAQARLREAEINAEAATRLQEGGFASETRRIGTEAALESARAGVQSARSALEAIRIDIARLTVTAPFEGLLETDTAELGSLVQPGGACATVIQLDPIKLVGFVPEADVDRIAVGAVAGARLISGREVQGRVTFLSRSADPATRTFRVEVTVPNPDLAIRDGQTAEMLIGADGVMAHLLPGSSLTLDNAGVLGVRLAVDGQASFAPVTVLRDTVEGVLVTGLPDEATVITVGQEFVTDGSPVTVTLRQVAP
ncbi:efflux RND transporter periplasmic adaptor subunit [Pseudotabrizicola algicola]|uniref:Efflux RND transporter periplasmic adaptor subunit n=1 Tax=Pseudotabrizicola algicola TaxID=2709381 RepID=A0A6B3RKD7_9RHOB|nr:efflux RND transporter periplasmic adaptor subunit [Pseudotabrizicola algicola]NEX44875.1 efflux RND transporter periplasmic adaptor subunit [Pseudotabrizicola algicola]